MNMKPILFSTPMVQAIIEGRKTMTRRVVPEKIVDDYYNYDDWCNSVGKPESERFGFYRTYDKTYFLDRCKYVVGDILWVRETFQNANSIVNGVQSNYAYKADGSAFGDYEIEKWKPSIFMPFEACRLFLKITGVRVERLQDISQEDAIKEGCIYGKGNGEIDYAVGDKHFPTLWAQINGEQSWKDNPWVYALTFEKFDHEV